jgi:hypothetical protein
MKLTWEPVIDRPYGEDHYNVPTSIGPVDVSQNRHYQGGWFWHIFGTRGEWVDDEGNQTPIVGGRTTTRRESVIAIESALAALSP